MVTDAVGGRLSDAAARRIKGDCGEVTHSAMRVAKP